ncbi:MAG: glycerol-3-phosphate 1-O-acyltransferase PlsY [Armatimonadetes bacterium]|nr:glycerol-3-phosphate 1-O-acyltransferase PlsY [Armatimonadota bacterium]
MMAWLLIPVAYLFGAVPFGLLIGRACGVDVRKAGSGNIGATNVWRTCGAKAGLPAFLLDVLKGLLPVLVARAISPQWPVLHVAAGMASLLGHSCSIFLGGGGGKGVSTSLGFLAALGAWPAVIGLALWAVVFKLTGYVSVGSLAGITVAALVATALHLPTSYKVAFWAGTLVIWVRHRSNLRRLMRGEELRFGRKAAPQGIEDPERDDDD